MRPQNSRKRGRPQVHITAKRLDLEPTVLPRVLLGRLPSVITDAGGWRVSVSPVLYSPLVELLTTGIIFLSFFLIIWDTDARAVDKVAPKWVSVGADFCFGYFVVEFTARALLERLGVFRGNWNRIDCLVVCVGLVEMMLRVALGTDVDSSMNIVRIFRVVRVLRLLRVLRIMKTFNELWKMVRMLATCGRTLFWAFMLAFLITTIWSVVLVEFISPLVTAMEAERQVWHGDAEWTNAYKSVMRSNLSLFQTIVAGDSWGRIPVPMMEAYPLTALIFVPAHVMLFFGVMNLIIAVVVETFADIRERNRKTVSEEMEQQEYDETMALAGLFEKIDTDHNGTITLDELEIASASIPELQQRLQIFGIKGNDLKHLYDILDEDGSGGVDMDEFVEVFCRMKCGDTRATTTLVKAYVMKLVRNQRQVANEIVNIKCMLTGEQEMESTMVDDGEPRASLASKVSSHYLSSENLSLWRASELQRCSTATSGANRVSTITSGAKQPSELFRFSLPSAEPQRISRPSESEPPRLSPLDGHAEGDAKHNFLPNSHAVEGNMPVEVSVAHLLYSPPPPGGPSAKALAFPPVANLIAGADPFSEGDCNMQALVDYSNHLRVVDAMAETTAESLVENLGDDLLFGTAQQEIAKSQVDVWESQEDVLAYVVV